MMQPIMREMMNRLMKVTPDHDNDAVHIARVGVQEHVENVRFLSVIA